MQVFICNDKAVNSVYFKYSPFSSDMFNLLSILSPTIQKHFGCRRLEFRKGSQKLYRKEGALFWQFRNVNEDS